MPRKQCDWCGEFVHQNEAQCPALSGDWIPEDDVPMPETSLGQIDLEQLADAQDDFNLGDVW